MERQRAYSFRSRISKLTRGCWSCHKRIASQKDSSFTVFKFDYCVRASSKAIPISSHGHSSHTYRWYAITMARSQPIRCFANTVAFRHSRCIFPRLTRSLHLMSQRTADIHPHPKGQTRHRSNRNRRGFVPVWCGMCIGCLDGHLDHIYSMEFRGLCWELIVQGIVGISLRPPRRKDSWLHLEQTSCPCLILYGHRNCRWPCRPQFQH
jgi:hypothetical protein